MSLVVYMARWAEEDCVQEWTAERVQGGPAPVFNPMAPGFFDDPYVQYAELRQHDPVHRSPLGVICFAYDDVWEQLRRPGVTMGITNVPLPDGRARPSGDLFPRAVLNLDPPDHTRVRGLMSKAFTRGTINRLTASIAAEVDRILDDLERQARETGDPVDLIRTLAFPLPFKVISDILGMPETAAEQVHEWAGAVTRASVATSDEAMAAGVAAYKAMCAYVVDEVLPWKRANPAEDLLSVLLAAHADGEMSHEEMLDQVTLLYVAGHETTSGLIGNGVCNLLRHRSQLDRLQAEPELIDNAVEELNRFEGTIQLTWRYPLEALRVRDEVIEPGDMLLLCLGSANRDPSRFGEDADVVDITRPSARELVSFGAGPHFCIGAPLARREAVLAIGSLVQRFPNFELAGDPVWNPRVIFRALDSLPVALGV